MDYHDPAVKGRNRSLDTRRQTDTYTGAPSVLSLPRIRPTLLLHAPASLLADSTIQSESIQKYERSKREAGQTLHSSSLIERRKTRERKNKEKQSKQKKERESFLGHALDRPTARRISSKRRTPQKVLQEFREALCLSVFTETAVSEKGQESLARDLLDEEATGGKRREPFFFSFSLSMMKSFFPSFSFSFLSAFCLLYVRAVSCFLLLSAFSELPPAESKRPAEWELTSALLTGGRIL